MTGPSSDPDTLAAMFGAGGEVGDDDRIVETSVVVPLDDCTDRDLVRAAAHEALERLLVAVSGQPVAGSPDVRMRVVTVDSEGRLANRSWTFGDPLPPGTVMLYCVADARLT